MPINRELVVDCLRAFDFKRLFNEIGWDNPTSGTVQIDIKDDSYRLDPVAEKRGVHVFTCVSDGDGEFPDRQTRQKIETRLRKIIHEHLIIFPDMESKNQIWQWVFRKPSQPARYREYRFDEGQTFEALIQKLESIVINLDDEEGLRLLDVTLRLKDAFDKDRVTKKFYDRFKQQQTKFRAFIEGIPDENDKQWYSAVMLNRLMFVYFIQKKTFLDDNVNYLKSKLSQMQLKYGQDKFYSFYRFFLRRLFHEGLNRKEPRGEELDQLLGNIPYLNGGIFVEHELEKKYADIDIKDEAFVKLFAFFDQYQWHLDDRPLRADNEINPEVLGYIFEKYVNQKELGAYYTKEDITEYISKNTIIPFLFDEARKGCKIAFEGERSVWDLLKDDSDRYIYDAVRKGVTNGVRPNRAEIEQATLAQMPENITVGLDTSKPNLLDRRKYWNTKSPENLALPTEIWRETIARWQRYFEVRAKLENGEVRSINDLITYNLNIRQFAQDVIENAEGPELIRAFYKAIKHVTVLDPTVGSGAFLFAALNILEPLYEACLDRMQAFVDELPEDVSPKKFSDFKNTLRKIADHPNRAYFIYKSIVINNLYGVDILEEAVEICKLRLFLKLVAQIEDVDHIESLPDIDFNIRSGNTLVGYVNVDEVKKGVAADLFAGKEANKIMERIVEQVEDVEALFEVFQLAQIEDDESALEFKTELQQKLRTIDEELNRYLAGEYGVDHSNQEEYARWLESHKPFHWFVEFYRILKEGGFDVIIGNPPYVEYSKVKNQYTIRGFKTERCGNLYAYCMERSIGLLENRSYFSFIVPVSSISTPRMQNLMSLLYSNGEGLFISNYAVRPAKLFVGTDMNLTIHILRKAKLLSRADIHSTGYQRWYSEFWPFLFSDIAYGNSFHNKENNSIPKISATLELSIWEKVVAFPKLSSFLNTKPTQTIYYHSGGRYFRKCVLKSLSNEYKPLAIPASSKYQIIALLSSNLYYWYWIIVSDTYHVTKPDIGYFRSPREVVYDKELSILGRDLLLDFENNAVKRLRIRQDGSEQIEVNYIIGKSKPFIDEIDKVLAEHYGFTGEELDFIINYDIKYRMGKELLKKEST